MKGGSQTWLSISTRECTASDSIAADPVYRYAMTLNTNTAKLLEKQ